MPDGREIPALRSLAEVSATTPATSWTWRKWLSNGTVSIVAGPTGAGKTLCVTALLRSIITGCPFPDGQLPPARPYPGNAVLMDYELMGNFNTDRALALGIPLGNILIQPQFNIPYLNRPDNIPLLADWLAYYDARILVIDSWRRGNPGTNENDAADNATVADGLHQLAIAANIPVVILMHTRKQPLTGKWTLTYDDVRGANSLVAVAHSVIVVEKPSATSEVRRLRVDKANDAAIPPAVHFEMKTAPDGETVDFQWVDGPVLEDELSPSQRVGRKAAPGTKAERLVGQSLLDGNTHYSTIRAGLKRPLSETTFYRALRSIATKDEDENWTLKTE